MALSTQLLERAYAVCPSPSQVIRVALLSCSRSRTEFSYGVAGSRVVPTTTIGPLPSAVIRWGLPTALIGQSPHCCPPQAMSGPQVGAFLLKAIARCSYVARSGESAASRHVTA